MGNNFSPQYIDALAECITGGSGWSEVPSIGFYRSGAEIAKFFRSLGYNITQVEGSRVPFTQDLLIRINGAEKGFKQILKITERLLDPRDYVRHEDKLGNVVNCLNEYLKYDGLELIKRGATYRLVKVGGTAPVSELFESKILDLSLNHVRVDFKRALSNVDADPAGAITSACSTLESIEKVILDNLGKPYPKDQSVQPLTWAVVRELKLAPDQYSENEIKRVLGSLNNIAAGIGVLRTKYGDAHGKGKEYIQLSPRHARLAVNATSTLGLFLVETYLEINP